MLVLRALTNKSSGLNCKDGKSPTSQFLEMKHREVLLIWRMASVPEPSIGSSEWRGNCLPSLLVKHLDRLFWLIVGLRHEAKKSAAFEFNTSLCPQSQQELCSPRNS